MDTILVVNADLGTRDWVTASPVMPIADDAELARAARAGSRAAFGRLYNRYARMVHGILLANVPRTEVDDLVQDVFLLALRQIAGLRDDGAFGGWLATIARNRACDYHRRAREWIELRDDLPAGDRYSPEALAALEAIRTLPEAYRDPLTMRLVEGMSGEEIAARTGLTPASVRVNLHRGMKQLRQKLESKSPHEK